MITVHYIKHSHRNSKKYIYTFNIQALRGRASKDESFGVDGKGDFTSNVRPYNSRISQFFLVAI